MTTAKPSISHTELRQRRREYLRVLSEVLPEMRQQLHEDITANYDASSREIGVYDALNDWMRYYYLDNWMAEYFLVELEWATPEMQEWLEDYSPKPEDSVIKKPLVATFNGGDLTFDFHATTIVAARAQAQEQFEQAWGEFVASLPQVIRKEQNTRPPTRGRPKTSLEAHFRWFARFQQGQETFQQIAESEDVSAKTVQKAVTSTAAYLRVSLRSGHQSGRPMKFRP